ncbi:ATP-binding protein [Nocardia seriolae]|uniref:ATP-binding protein n=1 Tax=Nocardia seriolae TaxID=37332 RepID=UPI0008FF343C|nr:AAA family ATPase [Nocardia seriolae]OJF78898.1 hypothetical protein NS14008_06360 [Nocardia seriolae]QOW30861.1 LuxR family transcriptional regulator [Nocardia seriolae]QUN15206.1 LuxR family transcriptional regulator [Nocardia seriolae]WNJ57793.1 LuxR C-terminal-related transcriptional regulator [Nocardia seriolae]
MSTEGFVGREPELERVAILLPGGARMVTLVGSGGIGKTRLAMTATARLRRDTGLPVYWAHLAKLSAGASADAVLDEIAAAVIDGDFSDRTARRALLDALGRPEASRCVLVLDNCEHVLDGVGHAIADLLEQVPELAVLATSRTAIGWVDEHLVVIPPLSRSQALEVFRQRADLSGHPIADADTEVVARICERLHNYPLHIRLAAARLRYQSPAMILRDLGGAPGDRRLRWSPGFRVGADDRHRDLGAVIGWSYDLCEPEEQALFARLSVFAIGYDANPDDAEPDRSAGSELGADLAAIEAICADPGGPLRADIETLLPRLVDRSLVLIHVGAETARYSLLESFQVFARERLRDNGDAEWLRLTARHRRYYQDRVTAVSIGWVSPREQELLTHARMEWDNIVYAIEGSLTDPDEAVIGLDMALRLLAARIPFLRGSLRECRSLAERSLAAVQASGRCPVELEVASKALIGWLSLCQGRSADADRLLEECADACLEPEARRTWRADPAVDPGLPAPVDYLWGGLLWLVDTDPRGTEVLARARIKFAANGDVDGATMSWLFEALSAAFHGTAEQALTVTRDFHDAMIAAGPQSAISWARFARAIAVSAHGDPVEGLALCDTALAWQIPMRDHWGVVWGLNIRAWILSRLILAEPAVAAGVRVAAAADRAREVARLIGGTAAIRRRLGLELANLRPFARQNAEAVEVAARILGREIFETAVREAEFAPGADRLPAVCPATADRAAGHTGNAGPAPAAIPVGGSPVWGELTQAEREVAVLAAAGMTNTAIATRRGTSTRTVDAQVASVLAKLMINSRKDIRPLRPEAERDRADGAARRAP